MAELTLEPYSAQLRFQLPAAIGGAEWQDLLAGYLEALAQACTGSYAGRATGSGASQVEDAGDSPAAGELPEAGAPRPVIGHIKLLALFPGHGYLRLSVVDAEHPASRDGEAPDGLAELPVTLNVLVYGVPATALEALARQKAGEAVAAWRGKVGEVGVGSRE